MPFSAVSVLVCCPFMLNLFNFLLLHWLVLVLLIRLPLEHLPPVAPPPTHTHPHQAPPSWPKLDSGETEADVPGAHNCPQPYPPTPPICTGSAVNPRKELTIQARTHTYKEHRGTNLYWLNSCPTEWTIHTYTHLYTHTKCCPNPLSVPDSSHPGVRSGVSILRPGSLWAAGLANPAAGGHKFSN